ncbi:hypothetical protein ACFPN0_31900 [Kitasatospora cinereorecta]
MGEESGLDLAGFDPEAADLDLVVCSSLVVEDAVPVEVGEVAGAVEAAARAPEGVRDEAGGADVRPPLVSVGEAVAREVELPVVPGGHNLRWLSRM